MRNEPDRPDISRTMHKVAGFVTRDHGGVRQLLVFRHPSAGIQLPAGTVEPEEAVEAARTRRSIRSCRRTIKANARCRQSIKM